MYITRFITREQREVLQRARETYGSTNQLLVSNEELCELAAVCAKFPRYEDPDTARKELHKSAVDEVSDVLIVLDHIISVFELSPEEIESRVAGKVDRLKRWLSKSDSPEQSTKDREVSENPAQMSLFKDTPVVIHCGGCIHKGKFSNLRPGGPCWICGTGVSQYKEAEKTEENK